MLNTIIVFQTKNTPENTFILFIFVYVSFGEEKKQGANTANAALRFTVLLITSNL